jgi:hypothetical protein
LNSIKKYKKEAIYKCRALEKSKVQDYLNFTSDYFEEKDPEPFSLGKNLQYSSVRNIF